MVTSKVMHSFLLQPISSSQAPFGNLATILQCNALQFVDVCITNPGAPPLQVLHHSRCSTTPGKVNCSGSLDANCTKAVTFHQCAKVTHCSSSVTWRAYH